MFAQAVYSNQQFLYIDIIDNSKHNIDVISLHCRGDAFCQNLEISIKVNSLNDECVNDLVGKKAKVIIANQKYFYGYITKASSHELLVQSYLTTLQTHFSLRVYRNKTIKEVIENILITSGLQKQDYQFQISNNFYKKVYQSITQINESDWGFLQRLLHNLGFIYDYISSADEDVLRISDELPQTRKTLKLESIFSVDMNIDKPGIYDAEVILKNCAKVIAINTYHPQQAKKDFYREIVNSSAIFSHGKQYVYGEDYNNEDEAGYLLKIRNEALDFQRYHLKIKTNVVDIQVGDFVQSESLRDFSISKTNVFRVVAIEHFASQKNGYLENIVNYAKEECSYYNVLTIIETTQKWRADFIVNKPQNYLKATIVAHDNDIPYIDSDGCYHIRYPFEDEDENKKTQQNIRACSAFTGINAGHHWPLHQNTDVLMGYLDDNLDKPIILGCLPSNDMQGLVTNENPMQHRMKTFSGHELLFDDAEYSISLFTPEKNQNIVFKAIGQHEIAIQANKGDLEIQSHQDLHQISDSNYQQDIAHDHNICVNENSYMRSQHSDMDISSNKDVNIAAKKDISFTTEKSNLHFSIQNDLNLEITEKSMMNVGKGNFQLHAKNALLDYQAQNVVFQSDQGNIIIGQGDGRITITNSGDVKIQAPKIFIHSSQMNIHSNQGFFESSGRAAEPLSAPIEDKKLWLQANYMVGSTQVAVKNTSVLFEIHDQNHSQNDAGFTNRKGIAEIADKDTVIPQKITLLNNEIIKVSHRIIQRPSDTVDVISSDEESVSDDIAPMKASDKKLCVDALFPPIILNVRDDAVDKNKRNKLTDEEINYFKKNGNNATVFIHGFNIPYGKFAKQIADLEYCNREIIVPDLNLQDSLGNRFVDAKSCKTIYKISDRTIYSDFNILSERFPEFKNITPPPDLSETYSCDLINGAGAFNWFVHMEDNLNRATGQFHRDDYTKFFRLINIAWSGDVFYLNYFDAEESADRAGLRLVDLLLQLHEEGIETNIIAHSLGNRVLLSALQNLGENHYHDMIENVFLWQAAMPRTSLSTNPDLDSSPKQNCHFTKAALVPKKITVLYSRSDDVLKFILREAYRVGVAPDEYFTQQYIEYFLGSSIMWALNMDVKHPFIMGTFGVDGNTKDLMGDKLQQIDQTNILLEHSGMKVPSTQLMNLIYKDVLLNKQKGIKKFGLYE